MSSKPTITDSLEFPSDISLPKYLTGFGVAGIIASAIGYFLNSDQFFFSYLTSFVFFTSFGLGALFLVMIHHLTRSEWGIVIRRIPEVLSNNILYWAIFFIPLLFGMHSLYHWTHEDAVAQDHILQGKVPYLNVPFYIIRQFIFFAVWGFLGYKLHKTSVDQDETGDWGLQTLQRRLSGPGIVLFALATGFASYDWLMSLDPHWFSTMFGVYFFAMSFQAIFPFLILMVFYLHSKGLLTNTIRNAHIHDLGNWMFAFTVFYAYIAFSQFLLIYYANMPEETLWYFHRLEGGYSFIAYSLLIVRFAIPFLVLLNRPSKSNRTVLITISVLILIMHFLEIYWIVMPTLHGHGIHFSWLDVTTFIGLGGIFMSLFFWKFKQHSMVPENDPKLDNSLAKHL